MSTVQPAAPWVRSLACVVLAGCANHNSATETPDTANLFANDPGAATVQRELPDPPANPAAAPTPCGECSLFCGSDQRCVGDVCAPQSDSVPRPLAPQSFGRVTSPRPTFRWVMPGRVQGARFQLCSDRTCAAPLQTVDLLGQTSFRPEQPLPPGVYFWRVQARRGTFLSAKPTPVWEFVVGARDTGVDTVLGRITDYNGDGYTDLLLRLGETRPLGVYLGGPEGLTRAPAVRITPPSADGVRGSFNTVGDIDGDGFLDSLSVVGQAGDPRQRVVYRYRSGPMGVVLTPEVLPLPAGLAQWPDMLSGAGDLNGDGYTDLLAVDHERGPDLARVRVYFGAAHGLQPAPDAILLGEAGDGLGMSASANGDMNGDGRPDLLLGAPLGGRVFVWLNRPGACLRAEVTPLWGDASPGSLFGQSLSVVGDFNGDGYADPLVAEPYTAQVQARSRLMAFQGRSAGVSTAPVRAMPFSGSQIETVSIRTDDFNGDGYSDAAVWMHNEQRGPSLYFFDGGPDGLLDRARRVIYPADLGSIQTGLSFTSVGDANRDGYDDLVISLMPTEWIYLRGSVDGLQFVDGPRLELP